MKRIKVNLYPSSGYAFKDKDGSWHRGKDWADVIARVTGYRKRNNMPLGDVEQDVHDYACLHNASLCHDETPQQVKTALKGTSMKGRVLKWLSSLRKKREDREIQMVPEAEAVARAEICLQCPAHQAYPAGCGSCKAAVRSSREEILKPRRADARLNGCNILGEDLGTSTHIEQVRVNNSDLPANCWRKAKS
jgi:hypothetical protein